MKKLKWLELYSPEQQERIKRLHHLRKLYDSKIILRFISYNFHGDAQDAEVEFVTVPVFVNYLKAVPHQGAMVGYEEKKYVKPVATTRVENMRVCFNWVDGNRRRESVFKNVVELTTFLDQHPDLAESVQYTSGML